MPTTHRLFLLPVVVLTGATLLLAACSPRDVAELDDEPASTEVALPEWIVEISPPPGAVSTAIRAVQVRHTTLQADQGIRLSIDGTDVTTYALVEPGLVAYAPDDSRAPVEVGPGTHTAVAELVTLPDFGEQHEVIDRFEWTFELQ